MGVDNLVLSISNQNIHIGEDNDDEFAYGRPKEQWLRSAIILQGSEAINSMINSPIRKSKYAHWTDRIMCSVCGKEYSRSNSVGHRRTKVHQAYEDMNGRIRDLLVKK